jgi:hypothetical protein
VKNAISTNRDRALHAGRAGLLANHCLERFRFEHCGLLPARWALSPEGCALLPAGCALLAEGYAFLSI